MQRTGSAAVIIVIVGVAGVALISYLKAIRMNTDINSSEWRN